jgi:hypothetical protein
VSAAAWDDTGDEHDHADGCDCADCIRRVNGYEPAPGHHLSNDDLITNVWLNEYDGPDDLRTALLEALDTVQAADTSGSRLAGIYWFPAADGEVAVFGTGGISWGNSPTDEFDALGLITFCPPVLDALLRRNPHPAALPDGHRPTAPATDALRLDAVANMLRDPEWGVGMLEDIADLVQSRGREIEGAGEPTWDRH